MERLGADMSRRAPQHVLLDGRRREVLSSLVNGDVMRGSHQRSRLQWRSLVRRRWIKRCVPSSTRIRNRSVWSLNTGSACEGEIPPARIRAAWLKCPHSSVPDDALVYEVGIRTTYEYMSVLC